MRGRAGGGHDVPVTDVLRWQEDGELLVSRGRKGSGRGCLGPRRVLRTENGGDDGQMRGREGERERERRRWRSDETRGEKGRVERDGLIDGNRMEREYRGEGRTDTLVASSMGGATGLNEVTVGSSGAGALALYGPGRICRHKAQLIVAGGANNHRRLQQ